MNGFSIFQFFSDIFPNTALSGSLRLSFADLMRGVSLAISGQPYHRYERARRFSAAVM